MKIVHSTISQKRAVLLLFILTTIGAGLGSAQAREDWKTMPGTYCRAAVPNSQDVGYFGSHRIFNKSQTNRLDIYCPLIRDTMAASAKLKKVVIDYQNSNPKEKIYCYVYVRHMNDGRALSQHLGIGKNNSDGLIHINSNSQSGVVGSYTLNCSLPPHSDVTRYAPGISTIHIQESD